MATVLSEHIVLSDGILAAITAGAATASLTVPTRSDLDDTDQHLLIFLIDTSGTDTQDPITFEVRAGITAAAATAQTPPELTGSFTSDVSHSAHEALGAGSITAASATNTIQFERTGGTGTLNIRGVTLVAKRSAVEPNTITGTP